MCGIRGVIYLFKLLHLFRCHIILLWRLGLHSVHRWVLCILVTLSTLQRCAQLYDLKIFVYLISQISYPFIGPPLLYVIVCFLVTSIGGAAVYAHSLRSTNAI